MKYFQNGAIPWLKTKEVNYGRITHTENFITDEGVESSSAKIIPINSVIVAMYGQGDTAGRVAINKIPLSTNQACCNLVIDKLVADYNFIFYYLWHSYDELVNRKTGSAQPNLNTQLIKSIEILLPPLSEQESIAAILCGLDEKIGLLQQQNKTLESFAGIAFRKAFQNPEIQDEQVRLDHFVEVNPLRSLPRGFTAPYLEMSNVRTDVFHPDSWYDREFSSGTKFQNGDTLLARITPCLENGKTCFVNFLGEGVVAWGSTEYIVLSAKPSLNPFFSYALAKNSAFRDFAIGCMSGSSGRQRVEITHLMGYELGMPSPAAIEEFNTILESIVPKLKANFKQIQTLTKMRDNLLPKLMSGEVRVKNG